MENKTPQVSTWDDVLQWAIQNHAHGVTLSEKVVSWTLPGHFVQAMPPAGDLPGFMLPILAAESVQAEELRSESFSLETGINYAGRRCRLSIGHTSLGLEVVVRFLPSGVLSAAQIRLPEQTVTSFVRDTSGMYFVVGAQGVGKSTTMTYLLDKRIRTVPQRVTTLEDPIEYYYEPSDYPLSHVSQQSVGVGGHVPSYAEGMRRAMRRDGALMVIQEIRDFPTLDTALQAAISGRVVLASLHASSCQEALQRIAAIYEMEGKRVDGDLLAMCLRCVIAQKMLFVNGCPRPIHEILTVPPEVAAIIRQGRDVFFKVNDCIKTGGRHGMQTFDVSMR